MRAILELAQHLENSPAAQAIRHLENAPIAQAIHQLAKCRRRLVQSLCSDMGRTS